MKLKKAKDKIEEPTVLLKNTAPGDCIRFAHDSFEDALRSDLFWMRADAPELKDRVRLINLADGKQLERDGDHRVITHNSVLHIGG